MSMHRISFLLLALTLLTTGAAFAAAGDMLLPAHRFDAALSDWVRSGTADFALDPAQPYEGAPSARIRIAPETTLAYQQLRRDFKTDIAMGDTLRGEVFVRSEGLTGDPGAYMAMEFLGAAGERVGIVHSKTGAANGSRDWSRLIAEGKVPPQTVSVRMSLILHAHGTAWFAAPSLTRTQRAPHWPDLGGATRQVTIHTRDVVHPRFGGVGFHAFHHAFPTAERERNEIIYKRWREIAPTFVRVNDLYDWDRAKWDDVAVHWKEMQATNPSFYVTTWNPKPVKTDAERTEYAEKVVDNLEYQYRTKGIRNIQWYCMTNELSLAGWGKLVDDLPTFKAYHQALYDALKRRKLPIGLLATDASPIGNWPTMEWAAENMDGITAIYGGHHYISDTTPDDETFYPWFAEKMRWGAGIARARGKDFILGEFGSKQDGRTVNGTKLDNCVYFGTPLEPLVGIQIAEAAIAAINGGVYAMGYWTFMDFPDDPFGPGYSNKWGLFRCSGDDRSTRDLYYAYGLLTRYFGGPSTVFRVDSADPRLRVAVQRRTGGAWTVAVVNRNRRDIPLAVTSDGDKLGARFRKFVYDPANVPQNAFGDLQGPSATLSLTGGKLIDTVGAGTLTVYTTDFDEEAPAAVRDVRTERTADGGVRVTWAASAESDHCYYRVYRGKERIGSTIVTSFTDDKPSADGKYHVVAVDRYGNAGR